MDDQRHIVGDPSWAGQTSVHPLGLAMVVVLGLCLLWLPRRWSVVPMLIIACFIPSAQRIVIAGCDFSFLRIMVLFGTMRLILHKEYQGFIWQPLDTAMILYTLTYMGLYILRENSFSAVINRLGFGFDAFGMYFLFRCLVRHWQDVDRIIFGIVIISIPVAFFFVMEQATGRNAFSIFGGKSLFSTVRDGRIRASGAYSHAILAGCFWAALMPLIAAFWWKSSKDRSKAIIGLLTSLFIVAACASSTPVMGVISAVVGGLFFFFRKRMRPIRWGILFMLIGLHLMMQAPVWHLISRVSAVSGSTGYHRYKLLNAAINNVSEWWLMGCSGYTVLGWGVHAADITNQYVLVGVQGGLLTLALFITVITLAFHSIGKLWRQNTDNTYRLALSWALGVSLFVHCTNFLGVSYFGQIHIIWYLLLAMIGSMAVYSEHQMKTMPKISIRRQKSVGRLKEQGMA